MGRFILAIILAVSVTAISLNRVQAEPPDPCHYGFCDE